jgi:hypothetical protein
MKSTKKILLAIPILLTFCFNAFAGDPAKPLRGCKSYDLKIETLTFLDEKDKKNLTAGDVVSLKFPKEIRQVHECPDETVSTLLNVSEVYESWMPQFAKTVINNRGISFFDTEGKLLYDYSNEFLASNDPDAKTREKSEQDNPFEVSEEDIKSFSEDGVEMKDDGKELHLKGSDFEMFINKEKLSTYFILYHEGKVINTEKTYYSNEQGIFIPTKKVLESEGTTLSGFLFTKVVISTYSNYKIS